MQKIQTFKRFKSGESFKKFSHLQKIQTFERKFVTFAKDSDIQKIQLKFYPESFKCFEYPANFTIFTKDSDIRKIQLW